MNGQKVYLDDNGNPIPPAKVYLDNNGNPIPTFEQFKASQPSSSGVVPTFEEFRAAAGQTMPPSETPGPTNQGFLASLINAVKGYNPMPLVRSLVMPTQENNPLAMLYNAAVRLNQPNPPTEVMKRMAETVVPQSRTMIEQLQAGNYGGAAGTAIGTAAVPGALAGVGVARPAISQALKNSAARNYLSTLLPGSKRVVPTAEKTAAQMAESKMLAPTRGRLQTKAQAGMKEWGPQAGTAFAKAAPAAFDDVYNAIEGLKDKYLYVKGTKTVPTNRAALQSFFDGAQEDLFNLADPQGRIPAQILDNYIDDVNKGLVGANQQYKTGLAPKTVAKMQQVTAGTLRTLLDTPNPTAAQINATYSMYARINDFTEQARRAAIVSKSGIVTGSSQGFGAAVQRLLFRPIRALPAGIAGVFDTVPWNTLTGAAKQSIADALAKGNWGVAKLLMLSIAGASFRQQQESFPSVPTRK
jgi:hypothetical protein